MRTDTIESIILYHSRRGMHILREKLPEKYCKEAAQDILSWERGNVLLTTGFYVAGYAETDGPVGTLMLAQALEKLGFHAIIVTDIYCKGFFEPEGIETVYMKNTDGEEFCTELVGKYQPVGMISIERCGRNIYDDYANMRGVSIKEKTAPVDMLFASYRGKIPTIGVGDGGNEIGMGRRSFRKSCRSCHAKSAWTGWSLRRYRTGGPMESWHIWLCFARTRVCSLPISG